MGKTPNVDRKWNLEAQVSSGDPPLIYLYIGEWGTIVFARLRPIAFSAPGMYCCLDGAGAPADLREPLERYLPTWHGRLSLLDGAKKLTIDELHHQLALALDSIAGQVVARWIPDDRPDIEIVTVERPIKIPGLPR